MTTAQKEPRIGELFAGYGGLGLGVKAAIGGDVAWFSEFDSAPSKILAHHWPDIPNHGDITQIDWSTVEPVDILTGGFPCQDVSLAGARKGLKDGTRSGLWSHFATAIAELRPSLVVIENVRGLLSAGAGEVVEWTNEEVSDMESATDGVGEPSRNGGSVLNAFGSVLGDLALLGFDAEWVGVRASDAGAPHGRFRVFIVAHPKHDGDVAGALGGSFGTFTAQGGHERVAEGSVGESEGTGSDRTSTATPYPASESGGIGNGNDVPIGRGQVGRQPDTRGSSAEDTDSTVGGQRGLATPGQTESGRTRANTRRRSGTPTADTSCLRGNESDDIAGQRRESTNGTSVADERSPRPSDLEWGVYEPAIRRWESVLNRDAPPATNPDGRDSSHRLAAEFVEWMMGLPAGHVTDPAIGLTRNQQLKALGNGVVWQQAALALKVLLPRLERAA